MSSPEITVGNSIVEELRQVNPHQLHWRVEVNQTETVLN